MRILKYMLPLKPGKFELSLPIGAKVLSADIKDRMPFIWAMADADKEFVNREFMVLFTGDDSPDDSYRFINTYQMVKESEDDMTIVYHLFEKKE